MKAAARPLTQAQFALAGASVLLAILPHVARMPRLFALLILVLFVWRMVQRLRGGARIPAFLKLPLVALIPILVIVYYGNVFGREPGSALACAMLVLKLVETESRRDARAAIAFASFVDHGRASPSLPEAPAKTVRIFSGTLQRLG